MPAGTLNNTDEGAHPPALRVLRQLLTGAACLADAQALIGQGAAVLGTVTLKRGGADYPFLWRALGVGEFNQPTLALPFT